LMRTGGMMPLPGRWLSSFLVRADGHLTLFDCGEGTQIAWRKVGWSFRRLGAICISHTHADHIAGLPGLLHAIANAGRIEPLDIFGPVGTASVVDGLRTIAPVLPFDMRVTELRGDEQFSLPGELSGSCVAGKHALPVLAYRLERSRQPAFLAERACELTIPVHLWSTLQSGERVIWEGGSATPAQVLGAPRRGLAVAYVTDTRPLAEIVAFVAGVDLLVCEGTYGSDDDEGKALRNSHMTFREAATLARDARVARLWITHFSPAMDDPAQFAESASAVFAETTIGLDGLTDQLTFSAE